MNYHNITTDDMLNGTGLRTVLWVSGCTMNCKNCHNPQAQDFESGIKFDSCAMLELFENLEKPYISGLTLSGGHPLEAKNLPVVYNIVKCVKEKYPNKTIWLYSGYTFEQIKEIENFYEEHEINSPSPLDVIEYCDVLVDGKYVDELRDISLPWVGSSNQRVIDIPKTLEKGDIILWTE